MFAKNHVRLLAAVLAFSAAFLAGNQARAVELQDFEGDWFGYYITNGAPVTGSRLSLTVDPTGTGVIGDWDGFNVTGSSRQGNVLKLDLVGDGADVDHYEVTCTLLSDGTLSLSYEGIDANGRAVRSGYTKPGHGFHH